MSTDVCTCTIMGYDDPLAWVGLSWPVSFLEPPPELSPCPLGSNQPKAPAGNRIATALPGHALPKLITFFCLFLLLLMINHSPDLGRERGLSERHQPQPPWARAGLNLSALGHALNLS